MRERSELARKGIARGRSVVALAYSGGVLFVAENPSRSLQKVSELYDRVGFAAVGRFNEFDNLRRGGIQFADTRGYAYDRRDVTGRQLANVYAQTLGTIFTEQAKPYEVELCVAEVAHYGETKPPELYRITYDGSIADEPHFVVMGGTTDPIATKLNESYSENLGLSDAVKVAVAALKAGANGGGSEPRPLGPSTLEVAILDANRPRRAFRRITGSALEAVLPEEDSDAKKPDEKGEIALVACGTDSVAGNEIDGVRHIVSQEVTAFLNARRQASVTPTVVALRSMATAVVEAEMERLASRLPELDEAARTEVLQSVRRVADKLLHQPTVRVKELANETGAVSYATALAELFALDPDAVDAVTRPEGIAAGSRTLGDLP